MIGLYQPAIRGLPSNAWFGIFFPDQLIRTKDVLVRLFRLVAQADPIGSALPCTDDCGDFATMWISKNLHEIPSFEWAAIESLPQCVDGRENHGPCNDAEEEPQNRRNHCDNAKQQQTAPIQERRASWFCGSDSQNCHAERPRAEPQLHRPLMGKEELDHRWSLHLSRRTKSDLSSRRGAMSDKSLLN